jgi:delta-aminolevulinic acid dehydratase/porphobilinogen synthase
MTVLDCSVTGCAYNEDRCCCKGDIKVEGKDAKKTAETRCGSFKEKGCDCGSNAVKRGSKEIDVVCDACNCSFNENHKCGAGHIGIAGGDACNCQETECASFACNC